MQDCIGVTYTATQSTLELLQAQKSNVQDCIHPNSIKTGIIQARN